MKRIALTIALLTGIALVGIAQTNDYIEDYHSADTSDYKIDRGGVFVLWQGSHPKGIATGFGNIRPVY